MLKIIQIKIFQTTIHRFTKIGLCLNDLPFQAVASTISDLHRSSNLCLHFCLTGFNFIQITKITTPAWTLRPEL